MTAEMILAEMAKVYAGSRSYLDTGCVCTEFLTRSGGEDFVSTRPFRTVFIRPARFRFEFSSSHPGRTERYRYIIHAEKGAVQTWWDLRPGVELPRTLGLALAGATGVSGGSAHTIASLLMPDEVGGLRLTDLAELVRSDDGNLDGIKCYRVIGRPPAPAGPQAEAARQQFRELTGLEPPTEFEPLTLWIDRDTLLLRRIDRRTVSFVEETTTYSPAVDTPISDEDMAFDPPC